MKTRPATVRKFDLFAQTDYKAYLVALIATYPNEGRGVRKLLAEAIRCQVAYVSHVLAGDYHFSIEQAEAAGRFFGLSKQESEFFVLLVSQNRSGTSELKAFFDKMLDERRQQNSLLKSRVKIKETLDEITQSTYYSQWYYAAIHMMLTIPELRTRDAIADKLRLPPRKVQDVLEFLADAGIARKEGLHYLPGGTVLHLEKNSPVTARHHTNWRLAAAQSLQDEKSNDLHYSGVVTVSEKDLPKVRERIARCLEDCMDIIKPSKEEKLVGLCLDWFEL